MSRASFSSASSSSAASEPTSVEATAAAYTPANLRRARVQPLATAIKHFPTIELTAEEQAHYDRVVGRLLYRTVQEYAGFKDRDLDASPDGCVSRKEWTGVRCNSNMVIYKSVRGASNPRVSLLLGMGRIDGSLEDVMDGVYSDTASDLRSAMTHLKSKFIAGAVLNASETRTPDDPFTFAGVKWLASKTPGGPVSYDRDLLYYERQGVTFDAEGNEVAYHLMQSIDRPEWPANTFKNLIRAHSSVCYLYKRRGRRVETFFWGEFYDSGRSPQLFSDFAIAGKWLSVVNAPRCSQAKKLTQLRERATTRHSQSSILISDINTCQICGDNHRMFSVQQLCGGCQQNVCKSCSKEKKLFTLNENGRPMRDRFCNHCLAMVAKQRGSKISWSGSNATQRRPSTPAFFNYAFHMSMDSTSTSEGREDAGAGFSNMSTLLSTGSCIDTAYLDGILQGIDRESSGLEDADWESYERRRTSHVETLNKTPYNREQFLAELQVT